MSCTETLMLVSLPWLQTGSDFFSILTPDVHQSPQRFYIESRQIVQTNYKSPVYEALNTARGRTLTHCQTVFYENYLFWPNTYMWFVSATIHMVWMMRFEETHQSVNLKENSSGQISLPLSSRQTKERGGETGGRRGDSKQSKISSSKRWRGWFRGGIKALPHCGASFYKVHHITSASHFHRYIIICLPPKPACYARVFCLKQD